MRLPTLERSKTDAKPIAGAAAIGAAGGVAGAYLLDPKNGRRRRAIARDRAIAMIRRPARRAGRQARVARTMATDRAAGAAHEALRDLEPDRPAMNDQELANRVRSEIFRPADVPKGAVSVNAEVGIVYLRGEVDSREQIERLVESAKDVDGVRAVENLLHSPGQPAPTKHETEPETRRRVMDQRI